MNTLLEPLRNFIGGEEIESEQLPVAFSNESVYSAQLHLSNPFRLVNVVSQYLNVPLNFKANA